MLSAIIQKSIKHNKEENIHVFHHMLDMQKSLYVNEFLRELKWSKIITITREISSYPNSNNTDKAVEQSSLAIGT
jgi:hypothetical protein